MKKTDEKQNPLHREYGLMSNIRWTLSAMRQHSKGLLTLIPIGIVCAPLMNYLWTFISKFVIDMITGEVGWLALLWIIGIFTVIQLVSTMLNTYYNSETGWRFIDTRFKLIGEKNRKVMTIDFEHLENPDVMDRVEGMLLDSINSKKDDADKSGEEMDIPGVDDAGIMVDEDGVIIE